MTALFDYPKSAAFGRVVPKNKIYEHGGASSRLKQLFVDQVDRIVWRYKLAPETINLPESKSAREIQVFEIETRTPKLDEDVLAAIDKAIAFPIIFEIVHGGKRRVIAALKRPSEADSAKWVTSEYFVSDWQAGDNPRAPLPTALNIGALYDKLLNALIPGGGSVDEPVQLRVARAEAIRAKTREVDRIQARLNREKQFNRRVAINAELRDAMNELKRLEGSACEAKEGGHDGETEDALAQPD